jgi:hypothetical protein
LLRDRLLDRPSIKEWIADTGPPQRRQGAFEHAANER